MISIIPYFFHTQLKNLGNSLNAVKDIENVFTSMSTFTGMGAGNETIRKLKEATEGYSAEVLKLAASQTTLTAEQATAIFTAKGLKDVELEQAVANATLSTSQTATTASTTGLQAAMKGLWATMKPILVGLATNPLTWLIAAGTAAVALEDAFTVDYEEAHEALEASTSKYQEAQSELESLKSEAESYKETLSSIADDYDISFSGTESISEMITALNNAGLSLVDQAEVDKIDSANASLEHQIELQERLTAIASKEAISDAREAMYKGDRSVAQSVKAGDSKGKKDFKGLVGDVTDTEAVKEDIALIQEYNSKIPELEENVVNLKEETSGMSIWDDGYFRKNLDLKNAESDLDHYNESIETLYSDLASRSESIQANLNILKLDPVGNADAIKELESALNAINNIDLSPAEQQLNAINSFFDGSTKSNAIKDKLLDAVKSGESATDALHAMGITLNDLGIQGEGKKTAFDNYFEGLVKSAEEAQSAVEGFNATLDDVGTAFESENAGADYSSAYEYYTKAKELFKSGDVGTDDFQKTVEYFTKGTQFAKNVDDYKYDADAYVAAWQEAQGKIQRYFTENPVTGINHAVDDLINLGLASENATDGVTWNFENTAQAANALGISVEATEDILGKLKDQGAEFDDVMFSGEGIERYETALNNIKSLYDSMDEGSSKDRLGGLIENWDSELEGYQTDLSSLTEDQIVHIEFEYDMAQLQSEIDELQRLADEGDNTAKAALNAKKSEYRDKREEDNGYDESNDEGYAHASDTIKNLQSQFKGASEETRGEIQDQISAIYDLQSAFQDAFADGEAVDWESFLKSDQANSVLDSISESTGLTREKLAELLDMDTSSLANQVHLTLDAELDASDVEAQLQELDAGSTITFKASVDDVEREVTAVKNEDGTISYAADVNGVSIPVDVTEKDGEVAFTANTSEVDRETAKTDGGTRTTDYVPNTSSLPSWFPAITRTVNYVANTAGLAGAASIAGKVVANIKGSAEGTTHYPARAFGTAINIPSHADGNISLQKDETALVNEIGQESYIRNGVWRLLPPGMHMQDFKKGDIILSASQTSSLMKFGKAAGTGKAYAEGTIGTALSNAYANGWRRPSGGSGTSSRTSSNKTSSQTASNSNAVDSSSINSATKSAKEFSEELDYIEIKIDRIEREIKSLELVAESAFETFGTRNDVLKDQISAVTEEISIQQKAYDRYIQQANSVGLSSDYAAKVRDGLIDIETITDETLKDNIENYQKW